MTPLILCKPQTRCPSEAPLTGAVVDPLAAARAQMLVELGTGQSLLPLPIWPQVGDLEDRREHLRRLFCAMYAYLRPVLEDVAQNAPRDLDLRQIEALYSDLLSEV